MGAPLRPDNATGIFADGSDTSAKTLSENSKFKPVQTKDLDLPNVDFSSNRNWRVNSEVQSNTTCESDVTGSTRSPRRSSVRLDTARRLWARDYSTTKERSLSMAGCGVWRNQSQDVDQTKAQILIQDGRASMHNHFQCKNVWGCPICTPAKVNQMKAYLDECMGPAIKRAGFVHGMLTLTIGHCRSDGMKYTLTCLKKSYEIFDQNLKNEFKSVGLIGKVKSVEVTFGNHGMHPHLHLGLVYSKNQLEEIEKLMIKAQKLWMRLVRPFYGISNLEVGFRWTKMVPLGYLAKELSPEGLERKSGRSFLQLLDRCSFGEFEAGKDYIEGMKAISGTHRWHLGSLPKILNIPCPSKWKTAQYQNIKLKKQKADSLIEYQQSDHREALQSRKRSSMGMILSRAEKGSHQAVLSVVKALVKEVKATAEESTKKNLENKIMGPISLPYDFSRVHKLAGEGALCNERDRLIYLLSQQVGWSADRNP
jgi:hypothetical protein